MASLRFLFERIANAAPPLSSWAESLPDDDSLDMEWGQLAREIVALAPDDAINALKSIAPLLEEAFERHNDQDQVSLGFIEDLIGHAEGKRLDPMRFRSSLGARGQEQWDSLSDYLHQSDWSLIHFDGQHIAGFEGGPAVFERWLVRRGNEVPADAPIARLGIAGAPYDLVVTLASKVSRFAVQDGHQLTEGDLLFYLLPNDYREFRRSSPYVALRRSSRAAA
jgi:hypothetical protein